MYKVSQKASTCANCAASIVFVRSFIYFIFIKIYVYIIYAGVDIPFIE